MRLLLLFEDVSPWLGLHVGDTRVVETDCSSRDEESNGAVCYILMLSTPFSFSYFKESVGC
jgi:hypothetical protein